MSQTLPSHKWSSRSLTWVNSSLALLLLLSSSYLFGTTEGVNICDNKCVCKDLTPYLIDCSQLKLQQLFLDEDWNETLIVNKISPDTLLDIRFEYNLIEKITRFPPINVVSLAFSHNKINYIEQSAFADLDKLCSLDLSHNQLTSESLPEKSFFGRYNGSENYLPLPWKHLSLAYNNIHSIQADVFDHLPYLDTIDLSSNPLKVLTGSTTQAIAELRNLRVLDLANTSIKLIPQGMLHELLHLESLDLSNNLFETPPEELAYSHNLTVLLLDGNKFKTLDHESFMGLENLDELSISNMPTLRMIEFGAFSHLKKLRVLKCTHNRKLNSIHDGAFEGITDDPQGWPVRELYLNDNGLTVLRKPLANWELIETLNIQDNPFRCDCEIQWLAEVLVPQIQSATPNLDLDITCNEPETLRGNSIIGMSYEHEEFLKCETGSHNIDGDYRIEIPSYRYQAAGVAVLAIGVILIVIGLSILGVIVLKRRAIAHALMAHQQIRYERADTDEDDMRERHRHYQPETGKV